MRRLSKLVSVRCAWHSKGGLWCRGVELKKHDVAFLLDALPPLVEAMHSSSSTPFKVKTALLVATTNTALPSDYVGDLIGRRTRASSHPPACTTTR